MSMREKMSSISRKTKMMAALVFAAVAAVALGVWFIAGGGDDASSEVKKFTLIAKSTTLTIDEGVLVKGFTFNDKSPGPQMVVTEGDTVEIKVVNKDTVTHGLSIHAANTQTSKYVSNIAPGESGTVRFKADYPGVYMYHCAPGGHGIMTHTMSGQHGMFVVEPKQKYRLEEELGREPDVKVYIVQHEVYKDGRDFFDGKPLYVAFNGRNFRYVTEPIKTRPGDYIRFYYLNVGPNLTSTFHAVGGVWNYIYYGGNPKNLMTGTQSVISGPTDSYVIDWQVPAEGPFTLVSHAFGTQAIKGAIGVIDSKADNPRVPVVSSEGPTSVPTKKPIRVVSPFGIGSRDLDTPVRFRQGDTIKIQMVGNSFFPKIAEVPAGQEIMWVNEDVFDFLEGERTGKHDAVSVSGPAQFATPVLGHAGKYTLRLTKSGTYEYICTIHPYMKGRIEVLT